MPNSKKANSLKDESFAEMQKDIKQIKEKQNKKMDFSHFMPEVKSMEEITKELNLNEYEVTELKKLEDLKDKAQSKMISEMMQANGDSEGPSFEFAGDMMKK